MSQLDDKINQHFAGLVVRKDLVKTVKGNAIVPTYVLEYLLGQYCATDDQATIETGIDTVREILRKHYVHRNEAGLVRSTIKEKGRHKVIDRISVALNDKSDAYEAEFANLGIKKVIIDSATVKTHPKLLVGGVWCIADLEYMFTEDKNSSPWILSSIKPIQLSHFDFDRYVEARKQFTTEEWIDLLIQSIGFNPQLFGKRNKLSQLVRLIPFCERNYNLIELGPKGTGKSHIFSEFSPHGILISGGEVTVPKLFVNNSSGKLGLVGYWDVVAFDEFAGKQKKVDKALVDILKNYMANKTFSRGVETLGAEASMAFVGNTDHTVPYMLKHSDLFDPLPEKFHDSAFLDRIHNYIPGWEVDVIRGEMFSDGYGFVVDYLAEILRSLRSHDFSDRYKSKFQLSEALSTRDRDGINKTFSGLMKILYPQGEATDAEIEEILRTAIEGRKRVKDQLLRIDSTYPEVKFAYITKDGKEIVIRTLEEDEYPNAYHRTVNLQSSDDGTKEIEIESDIASEPDVNGQKKIDRGLGNRAESILRECHIAFQENQRGVSFDKIFGPYLVGSHVITVTDPYLRLFHQQRNVMELLETISKHCSLDEEVRVHIVTAEDEFNNDRQSENFQKMSDSCLSIGIKLTWEYDTTGTKHDRDITTDTGWKIVLSRGLDIFQRFDVNDAFSFSNRMQQYRQSKEFNVTYVRIPDRKNELKMQN
ncbi:BREX system Lon protease-like protein BrxL [Undibacterium sp. LX40W]|uniref:BREX system Lon protease-like protein BrxL n=1 Tax=Undibacterium nitidum TaxID=2762298 RepID=A0A923HLF9_9BURK|nr:MULTISPECIES: BREX system Lon protease-like protein BrxL [Undibacterium]MBC3881554.1 BREX system Lon protease-like protein BrxL [Undibacterium nitidum]MBC3891664.1 BREX system Lon protease-like protein BrxL [Undibacterium sp. LX40W]